VGGLAETVGLVASIACVALLRNDPVGFRLSALGAAGFAGMLLSYAFGNRPVNDQIANWSPANIPMDWSAAQAAWENAPAISAALAAIALISLLFSILRDPVRS
jgi:hypothetical protein